MLPKSEMSLVNKFLNRGGRLLPRCTMYTNNKVAFHFLHKNTGSLKGLANTPMS